MIEIVRAVEQDADAVTEVYLQARAGAGDAIPLGVHPPHEVREYVAQRQIAQHETWIAREVGDDGAEPEDPDGEGEGAGAGEGEGEGDGNDVSDAGGDGDAEGRTVGVLVLGAGRVSGVDPVPVTELDWLWVLPDRQGTGIGTALLDHAKALAPAGLALWTFVSNEPARVFYERRGFLPVGGTDGSGNEEGAPDVRYLWRPDA